MKKITYSLNYRKPKNSYKNDDELMVCLRSYQKLDNGKFRVVKKSTGIKCKLKDWDSDWHKSVARNPIKSTDKKVCKYKIFFLLGFLNVHNCV